MPGKTFQKILQPFSTIMNLGISDQLSFHEKAKTQLLNLAVASGMPVNLFFCIHNLTHNRPVLCFINVLLLAGAAAVLYINSLRRFLLSRLIMTFIACALFSASAILFRNGGEYYLIANLVIIILYFNERWFLVIVTLFNCLLFIGIKIFLSGSYVFGTVPLSRVIFNISWTLVIVTLALLFFKYEQLSYQEQVEEKNKELEKMNASKQKLFSIIAHDLRSPIAQLKGSLDLVNKQYLSPQEFRSISEKLSTQVDQLHTTLENLLRWSISQLQGIVAKPEKIEIIPFVGEKAVSFLQQSMDHKKLRIAITGDDAYVWADPEHLTLVFRNLVANAIKYSYPNTTISIRAYQKEGRVITEISDCGIGMNRETIDSVFNPVQMISNTGTSNEKGTGLGLKLCQEFLAINKGHIWVSSTEGQGSTFFVSLLPA